MIGAADAAYICGAKGGGGNGYHCYCTLMHASTGTTAFEVMLG